MRAEDRFEIIRHDGTKKAKVHNEGYGDELLTMRNGFQWSGQPIDYEIAKLTIDVLQLYIKRCEAK